MCIQQTNEFNKTSKVITTASDRSEQKEIPLLAQNRGLQDIRGMLKLANSSLSVQ
jgi:spore coat polysaccharide biosynthesis protein SpsF (cytidylyltransferase family)